MPFDYSRLRGRVREKLGTEGAYAKAIGRSHNFVSSVFAGNSVMTQDDITKSIDVLEIDTSEIGDYFFTQKVHKSETEQTDKQQTHT